MSESREGDAQRRSGAVQRNGGGHLLPSRPVQDAPAGPDAEDTADGEVGIDDARTVQRIESHGKYIVL